MHNTQNKSILTLEDHHLNHNFWLPFTLSSKKTLINFKFILDKFFLLCYTKFIVKSAYYSTYVIIGHHTPLCPSFTKTITKYFKKLLTSIPKCGIIGLQSRKVSFIRYLLFSIGQIHLFGNTGKSSSFSWVIHINLHDLPRHFLWP